MASLVEDVIDVIISNKLEEMIDQITPDVIRNTINAGDVEKANEILETVLMAHLSDDSKYFLEECQATKESLKVNALSSSWGL
jgi:dTDP-4-dehydrorhamnose reductase